MKVSLLNDSQCCLNIWSDNQKYVSTAANIYQCLLTAEKLEYELRKVEVLSAFKDARLSRSAQLYWKG